MSDASTTPAGVPNDPVAAAVALLRDAEVAAGQARAEAERYAKQRELEADLLVQKARRLLVAAEGKAEVIVATARAAAASADDHVIDLDALGSSAAVDRGAAGQGPRGSELDKMLESAIARAVTDAFPIDAPS